MMAKRPSHLRKVPTQDRSRRRLESIIDAAAELFAEHGFDATTIEAIAAAADTSVGSVYQFFPNKLAVFRGVADRIHERVRTAYIALLGPDPASRDMRELIASVVDGLWAIQRSDPAFRAVWTNTQLYGEFEEDDMALEQELVAATERIMGAYAPGLEPERLRTASRLMVQTASAGLFLTIRDGDEEQSRRVVAELKVMLQAYAEALVKGT